MLSDLPLKRSAVTHGGTRPRPSAVPRRVVHALRKYIALADAAAPLPQASLACTERSLRNDAGAPLPGQLRLDGESDYREFATGFVAGTTSHLCPSLASVAGWVVGTQVSGTQVSGMQVMGT